MAFAKEDVAAAIAKFRENPFWDRKFMDAPVGAQKRLALSFFFSERKDDDGFDLDGYRNLRDYIEKSLTAEDLDYLIANDSNENAKKHFGELKAALAQNPQGQGQTAQSPQGGVGAPTAASAAPMGATPAPQPQMPVVGAPGGDVPSAPAM